MKQTKRSEEADHAPLKDLILEDAHPILPGEIRASAGRGKGALVGPLCSRIPHDKAVVVRRAQLGPIQAPPVGKGTSKLGGSIYVWPAGQLSCGPWFLERETVSDEPRRWSSFTISLS